MNLDSSPWYSLRDHLSNGPSVPTEGRQSAFASLKKELKILCAACQHPITSPTQRIQMDGSHEHTFFNPHGIVFHIGCFRQAPGCMTVGNTSREFSWFKDYAWLLTGCKKCHIHLGWLFVHFSHDRFHGLILNRLQEQSDYQ